MAIGNQTHIASTLRKPLAEDPELAEVLDFTLTYGTRLKDQLAANQSQLVPAHIAYDKKVLSFKAYFKEAVPESPTEKFRVRFVRINYFLEDDSINVLETAQVNSGLPQGVFLRRQRVPRSTVKNDFYTAKDFNVAVDLALYGRVYRIYDCDGFTRNYYQSLGITLTESEVPPTDQYSQTRLYSECPARNAATPNANRFALRKFLENDRKVLRFYCSWDNSDEPFGECRPYVVQFFLVDDTVEVREVNTPNDGRDPFPIFLRRQRLTKTSGGNDYYLDEDFKPDCVVNVLGRPFLIYDADKFTKDYYSEKFGIKDWPQTDSGIPDPQTMHSSIPGLSSSPLMKTVPHRDMSIETKPPRVDLKKMMDYQGKLLRFRATMETQRPEYRGRAFVVAYYLANDTIGVGELPLKDGIPGGRFLERTRLRHPERSRHAAPSGYGLQATDDSREYYQPSDFFVGARISLLSWTFVLHDADEATLRHMEANPYEFPMSNVDWVLEHVAAQLQAGGKGGVSALKAAFQRYDHDGSISGQQLKDALLLLGVDLAEQEKITLLRRYDLTGEDKVHYFELCTTLDAYVRQS
eukprot:TRINITY_DN3395_c0_g1_i2.p2 TRINITY_DN3395_c0_g1~~TRINITY_DN3395_c0_g1_i2.p2  ORF type:complete len:649 (+),score=174.07 TRINITY_DN3395_c0_g1_i2:213-1949(+)